MLGANQILRDTFSILSRIIISKPNFNLKHEFEEGKTFDLRLCRLPTSVSRII